MWIRVKAYFLAKLQKVAREMSFSRAVGCVAACPLTKMSYYRKGDNVSWAKLHIQREWLLHNKEQVAYGVSLEGIVG